jgi:hypothetical protein
MRRFLALITTILSVPLVVQAQGLELNLQQQGDNNLNWEMTLAFSVTNTTQNGMFFDIPEQLRLVPMNVQVNQDNIWLQNSEQVPQMDSVATWYAVDQGLVFLFTEGMLNSGDQLQITCMATLVQKELSTEEVIEVRPILTTTAPVQISDQVVASANIPFTLTR